MRDSLTLDERGCYYLPKVRQSDKGLIEKVRVLNRYLDMTVIYRFGDRKEILSGMKISKWIRFDCDGRASVDMTQLQEYVKSLADTYDTAYKSREFKTSYGPVVRIHQGDYGFQINRKKETEALKKIVLSGKSRERTYLYPAGGKPWGSRLWRHLCRDQSRDTTFVFI